MTMAPFDELFPDLARSESRSITVIQQEDLLPGSYLLREAYCVEPRSRLPASAPPDLARRTETPGRDPQLRVRTPEAAVRGRGAAIHRPYQPPERSIGSAPGLRRDARHGLRVPRAAASPLRDVEGGRRRSRASRPRQDSERTSRRSGVPTGIPSRSTARREGAKVGPNDACPCGSGRSTRSAVGRDATRWSSARARRLAWPPRCPVAGRCRGCMNASTWTVGLTVSPTSMKTTRCGKRPIACAAHVVRVAEDREARVAPRARHARAGASPSRTAGLDLGGRPAIRSLVELLFSFGLDVEPDYRARSLASMRSNTSSAGRPFDSPDRTRAARRAISLAHVREDPRPTPSERSRRRRHGGPLRRAGPQARSPSCTVAMTQACPCRRPTSSATWQQRAGFRALAWPLNRRGDRKADES